MRIVIVGLGKSGTTALLYKIAAGLPGCELQPNGTPKKRPPGSKYVIKSTYNPGKGRTFDLFHKAAESRNFDRLIWIVRDPRDQLVSDTLFYFHKGAVEDDPRFRAYMDILHAKERDPRSVPFTELLKLTGPVDAPWPRSAEDILKQQRDFWAEPIAQFPRIRKKWFIYRFEDMVAGRYEPLEKHLRFPIGRDAEITDPKRDKVVRKKAAGDWRNWFTPEDLPLMHEIFDPALKAFGYDVKDWNLNPQPEILPEHASGYVLSLIAKARASKEASVSTPATTT